ncbi:MAG: PIN domain-containing protein [Candidatus Nanopelagicales bacterium]|nr:PIN domain-containing protein [Candidatus Nanopelagicales bacterium]MCF8538032.1 PIN domain-containing protein [Candidatus Nanopelagicales bacterium]MCF8542952.1 PIN domain-containing protein [Candidatus Nanopelagicales bacterium]MCF8557849.1 PIN domain-containing protein [Candidatus Nanopelagicales bacterium]
MIAYVDANIILDALLAKRPFTVDELAGLHTCTSAISLVEIARRLRREDEGADVWAIAQQALEGVDVVAISLPALEAAGQIPVRHLRSLDAIHVATALITRCDRVLTRDRQMARACEELGLKVA